MEHLYCWGPAKSCTTLELGQMVHSYLFHPHQYQVGQHQLYQGSYQHHSERHHHLCHLQCHIYLQPNPNLCQSKQIAIDEMLIYCQVLNKVSHCSSKASTGVEISIRILTQGGATVQGTISFTSKIFLVAKILFFNLDPPKFAKSYISSLSKTLCFWFFAFSPIEAHYNKSGKF